MNPARTRLVVILLTLVILNILFFRYLHPYLAITRAVHGPVMVVEGWMPEVTMIQAERLFTRGPYTHMYVTGTVRPLSQLLATNEALSFRVEEDSAVLVVELAGLNGTPWYLTADTDTLLSGAAFDETRTHEVILERGHGKALALAPAEYVVNEKPVLFIRSISVNDRSIVAREGKVAVERADGVRSELPRSYAETGAAILVANGMDPARVTALPVEISERGQRTRASAKAFHAVAVQHGIKRFDIMSMSVHARRTWRHYKQVFGGAEGIGIVALPDPECNASNWWRNKKCFARVFKELFGMRQLNNTDADTFDKDAP